MRDGRSEIDGDFVATIVDLQMKVDFKELFNRKRFRSFVKKNDLFVALVVSTSRQIEIEIENVLSVETNF